MKKTLSLLILTTLLTACSSPEQKAEKERKDAVERAMMRTKEISDGVAENARQVAQDAQNAFGNTLESTGNALNNIGKDIEDAGDDLQE